jgi:DHA2 family multidrug resistance protein
MYQLSAFSLQVASWHFYLPLLIQGAGVGLIFVPLTTVTNDPVPNERMGNAASIFNLMRNLGASIGISMVETLQARRLQTHINVLVGHVNMAKPQVRGMVSGLRHMFIAQGKDAATATRQADDALWAMVRHQAAMLSYNDAFRFLGLLFLVMFPLIFLMTKPRKRKAAMAH